MDRGLERELLELGLHPPRHFMLPEEEGRDLGVVCQECSSPRVVYTITRGLRQEIMGRVRTFPAGAYCYLHLVKQCRASGLIPFPIEQTLLDNLKLDLGIPLSEAANASFRVKQGR